MPFSDIQKWITEFSLLDDIIQLKPVTWLNPHRKIMSEINSLSVNRHDMDEAEKLWQRFAPYLSKAFPETGNTNGIIESPLREIENLRVELNKKSGHKIEGKFFFKCDNELPIAGSIKARGGLYEVLNYAEELALKEGLIEKNGNYELFASDNFKNVFRQHSIAVGSTGNLGLSIGIISAKLGFRVSVYMSTDARQWKKDLLRSKGATVVEIEGDFGKAVNEGRRKTIEDPKGYFVDDENSKHLFLGYSVAAIRLKNQLDKMKIIIDHSHPLFVYLPCGVGGSPGGIAFGLKKIFGDNVHCFFAEPTHSPSVLIGMLTGKMEKVSVHDFGIDNQTEADGLAVGRPSAFATPISQLLISGVYTMEDDSLFRLLYLLGKNVNIFVEPSATAGLAGPEKVLHSGYIQENNLDPAKIIHVAWAIGGALVPADEMNGFFEKGKKISA